MLQSVDQQKKFIDKKSRHLLSIVKKYAHTMDRGIFWKKHCVHFKHSRNDFFPSRLLAHKQTLKSATLLLNPTELFTIEESMKVFEMHKIN